MPTVIPLSNRDGSRRGFLQEVTPLAKGRIRVKASVMMNVHIEYGGKSKATVEQLEIVPLGNELDSDSVESGLGVGSECDLILDKDNKTILKVRHVQTPKLPVDA